MAAILVSGIAIAALAISAQGLGGFAAFAAPPEPATDPAIAKPRARAHRCAECGVVQSTREMNASNERTGIDATDPIAATNRGAIGNKSVRNYEITIRMRDGSLRVITDADPAILRQGEQVIIIAGADE